MAQYITVERGEQVTTPDFSDPYKRNGEEMASILLRLFESALPAAPLTLGLFREKWETILQQVSC